MSMRFEIAQAASALSTWALKDVLGRPAANFPGKAALLIDPDLIAELKPRLHEGSVMVVGTNGKTTVTNLLADAFEAAGKSVACNRTGANLDSGLATSLLHTGQVDWGVFESDELWLAKTLPHLRSDYVVLLNLFRDQLDRMGEIDHIQAAIAGALAASPDTKLVYNADDPLCQAIAEQVPNGCVPFGFDENLGLPQNSVADARMCQRCDTLLDYEWRQYGQLGSFRCPNCGFARVKPRYAGGDVAVSADGASFTLRADGGATNVRLPFSGSYMLYNALAVFAAADCCGIPLTCVDEAIQSFAPENGRLQPYEVAGHSVLLNLAKNPTGFNQNLRIVMSEPGPKAVAFFINDREADGHDVSWLWDVDFQELSDARDLAVFAGGIRRNDTQVRLKHAGVDADLVDGAGDFLAKAIAGSPDAKLFLIANYTALPDVKAELDRMAAQTPSVILSASEESPRSGCSSSPLRGDPSPSAQDDRGGRRPRAAQDDRGGVDKCCPIYREKASGSKGGVQTACAQADKLTIVHLYPELLNLYGDSGNAIVLANRARWRGIEAEVVRVGHGEAFDPRSADIVLLGGGPDREQRLASLDLLEQAPALRSYVDDDGVLLAICGGYQILGREWLLGEESVPGLGILDITTKRAEGGSHNRLVGNIALASPLASMPVIGYENHAGRTYLGSGCEPFGRVAGRHGKGNNDDDGADGVRYRNVVGTYLHGPVLAKNPEVADWLIERALARRAAKEGTDAPALQPLDDAEERAANAFMRHKLGV